MLGYVETHSPVEVFFGRNFFAPGSLTRVNVKAFFPGLFLFKQKELVIMGLGWVSTYREELSSSLFHNGNVWRVWSWIKCRMNHKTVEKKNGGHDITLHPGSFMTSLTTAGRELPNMTEWTIRSSLEYLSDTGRIKRQIIWKGQVISVVDWAQYIHGNKDGNWQNIGNSSSRPQADLKQTTTDNKIHNINKVNKKTAALKPYHNPLLKDEQLKDWLSMHRRFMFINIDIVWAKLLKSSKKSRNNNKVYELERIISYLLWEFPSRDLASYECKLIYDGREHPKWRSHMELQKKRIVTEYKKFKALRDFNKNEAERTKENV